jgi:hypothetical protein
MKTTAVGDHTIIQAPIVQDITLEEAADWVVEEFHALSDISAIEARIGLEAKIVAANAHREAEFPMTHFAHTKLLSELQDEYARQTMAMPYATCTVH